MLASDKIVMRLSHKDQIFWPVYVTIDKLDAKMYWSQNWLDTLFLGSISIVYNRVEDSKNKKRDLRAKIYYMALKIMLKYI